MRRLAFAAPFAAALAVAPAASPRVAELGSGASAVASKCPDNPCEVVGRVTGYQGRSEGVRNPFVVPRAGKIVAFTVRLSRLEQNQVTFFNDLYGSPASVRLSILRRGRTRRTRLDHRLMAQSPTFRVDRYLGSTPSFALDEPLTVRRGYIVALSAPTWVPAFARDLPRTNWWRSSRRKGDCDNVSQRATMQTLRRVSVFGCTYHTARLLYSATYVPDPRPTS